MRVGGGEGGDEDKAVKREGEGGGGRKRKLDTIAPREGIGFCSKRM